MVEIHPRRLQESALGHILVGLFVLAVSVGFAWLLVKLRSGPERYALVAEFDRLGNISQATQVKLRGYTVGRVDAIDFRPSPPPGESFFLVELGIETGVPVAQGTHAEIHGSGLVGEAYIELVPPARETSAALAPGSRLRGVSDSAVKTLMGRLTEAAGKLGGAGAALRDAGFGAKMTTLNADVSRIAEQLERVARSADTLLLTSRVLITGLQPSLERSLSSLDRSMASVAATLGRTDTLVAVSAGDVRSAVVALRQVAEHLDQLLVRVDSFMQLKEGEIDSTLSNLHQTSASLRELSAHPWKAVTGQARGGRVGDEIDALRAAGRGAARTEGEMP